MDLVCCIAIVVGCSCLPSSTDRSSLRSRFSFGLSWSICSCDTLHAERYIACWFTIVYNGTRHGNVLCIDDGFRKWLYHGCCYHVLTSFSEIPIFLKPLFFLCKGSVMLRQMESVLCGRFAVTNKIADNLPFSPHRQQKTSIIVDFHGAALMCHIPAFELHVKIKFHFKK